jgi:hypothetical protein
MTSTAAFSGGKERYGDNGLPILIPKDYRGEMLRSVPAAIPESDVDPVTFETYAETAAEDAAAAKDRLGEPLSDTGEQRGTSLIGGIYDLLLGDNSAEEETLLLLGIALLLLWGHLDRGGLFDRSTWDGDDLALLLIGYLLLS